MKLSPEHSISMAVSRVATAIVSMDLSALNRYRSDGWFSRTGSFVRVAEWIGVGPVSLSMYKGSNS
jgi:hypothetical protein